MKTSKTIFAMLLILSVAALSLSACQKQEKQDQPPRSDIMLADQGIEARIEKISPPNGIVAGKAASFKVSYWKPDPCHHRIGYKAPISGEQLDLKIFMERKEGICAMVMVLEQMEIPITFPAAGSYHIRYKGVEGPDSLKVLVY